MPTKMPQYQSSVTQTSQVTVPGGSRKGSLPIMMGGYVIIEIPSNISTSQLSGIASMISC